MKDEPKVFSGYSIKFNQVCKNGNVYLSDSITTKNLQDLKISGEIEDFEVNENGIKTIKLLGISDAVGNEVKFKRGLTCMMCRQPKENDGHTCCEDCAGLSF